MPRLLSIVIPLYNEELVIEQLQSRLVSLMDGLDMQAEVILVNDGSRDATAQKARRICQGDQRFKLIGLSRNFGHQLAITAGIERAAGDAVVVMDADLQDPPEVILEMLEKWKQGYAVVYGVRRKREGERFFKVFTAAVFYRLLRRLTDIEVSVDAGDFRLMDRRVVDQLNRMRERFRFLRGMVSWVGFPQCNVEYVRAERFAGTTKFPFRKMLRFALDGIFSFSQVPLRLASILGFLCSTLSFAMVVYGVVVKLFFRQQAVPGWASIFVAVLFIGGVQLICIGILGEYLGRIYDETKRRPLYITEEELNLDRETGFARPD